MVTLGLVTEKKYIVDKVEILVTDTGGTPVVPLFATLPPFRNTAPFSQHFSGSLGVAKRGTTGVL